MSRLACCQWTCLGSFDRVILLLFHSFFQNFFHKGLHLVLFGNIPLQSWRCGVADGHISLWFAH